MASPPDRGSSHTCAPRFFSSSVPREARNDRYLPSGLQRGDDSPSGDEVSCTCSAAAPPGHPDVRVALVLVFVDGGDRVGHPLAVGRPLGIGHGLDARVVGQGQRAAGWLGLGQGARHAEEYGGEDKSLRHVQTLQWTGRSHPCLIAMVFSVVKPIQRLEALLAAVARRLDAAERQLDAAAGAVVVDEHLAASQRARQRSCRAAVARPDAGDQAVVGAVGERGSPRPRRRTASPPAPGRRLLPAPARWSGGTSPKQRRRT